MPQIFLIGALRKSLWQEINLHYKHCLLLLKLLSRVGPPLRIRMRGFRRSPGWPSFLIHFSSEFLHAGFGRVTQFFEHFQESSRRQIIPLCEARMGLLLVHDCKNPSLLSILGRQEPSLPFLSHYPLLCRCSNLGLTLGCLCFLVNTKGM